MKHSLQSVASAALVISSVIASAMFAATAEIPQGYTLFTGEQARLALAGNLLRVAVRPIVRPDGSKATVYRDVDYPVRKVGADGKMETGRPSKPKAKPTEAELEAEAKKADAADAAEEVLAPEVAAYIFLGPEYEDPPPPGAAPSPNRLRRSGPASITYEWDEYKETKGKGDEYLRLELDLSGTHVAIRSGHWRMEAEAGDAEPSKKPGCDFICGQGAYGEAMGWIEKIDLSKERPGEIVVTLVTRKARRLPRDPLNEEDNLLVQGSKTYALKRVPAKD